MTPNRFQDWLSKLELQDVKFDYKYNSGKKRFEVLAFCNVNGIDMVMATYVDVDWLNDTRKIQGIMDKYIPGVQKALERAGKKFSSIN